MSEVSMPPALHPDEISPGYVKYLIATGVLTFLAVLCVALRFMSRSLTLKCWWDDWAILGSLICALGAMIGTALVATVGGAGYHINTYSVGQLQSYLKITLAHNCFWTTSISLSKLSVVLFYYRIFTVDRKFRRTTYFVIFLIASWFLAALFSLLFAYNPVHAQWTIGIPFTVIDTYAFYLAIGFTNFAIDLVIFAMPQTKVWKLQMSLKQKLLTSLVFAVGIFVCLTSIIRIVTFTRINTADITYSFTIPGVWTMTEMNTSIICTCLPTLPALFRHIRTTNSNSRSVTSWLFRSWRSNSKSFTNGYSEREPRKSSQTKLPFNGIQVESRIDVESFDMHSIHQASQERQFS